MASDGCGHLKSQISIEPENFHDALSSTGLTFFTAHSPLRSQHLAIFLAEQQFTSSYLGSTKLNLCSSRRTRCQGRLTDLVFGILVFRAGRQLNFSSQTRQQCGGSGGSIRVRKPRSLLFISYLLVMLISVTTGGHRNRWFGVLCLASWGGILGWRSSNRSPRAP